MDVKDKQMSLSELRAELKNLRRAMAPRPVSKMKKADCAREIERLKGLHKKEEAVVREVHDREEKQTAAIMKKAGVSKKAAKKVMAEEHESHGMEEALHKKEHKKQVKALGEKKSRKPKE